MSDNKGEAFGVKSEEFDWEAFINRFEPPETMTVTLYARDRNQEFQEATDNAQGALEDGDEEEARRLLLVAKEIREDMEASAIDFVLKPLDPDTWRNLVRRDSQGEDIRCEQLGKQVIKPKMSTMQWMTFGKRVGAARFDELYGAAYLQMTQTTTELPDFSPGAWDMINKGQNS